MLVVYLEITGKAGIVVNPYDYKDIARGINKALFNKDKLVRLGLERCKIFTWEKLC